MGDIINFSSVCRACLISNEETVPLFSCIKYLEQNISLAEMFMYCTSIQVSVNDNYPQVICKACMSNIQLLYKFRLRCYKSQILLQKNLESKVPAKTKREEEVTRNETLSLGNLNQFSSSVNVPDRQQVENVQYDHTACIVNESSKILNNENLGKSNVEISMIEENLESNNKQNVCRMCGKGFSSPATLKLHTRCHTGDKPYLCSFCGKTCARAMHLTVHMRTHTGQRPYICTYCGKSFKQSSDLKVHIRIHTGERNNVCRICNKAFVTASALSKHLRVHTGDRPFKCNVCARTFSESGGLVKHTRVHTGYRPYKCSTCSKGFSQFTTLKRHMKVHC